MKKIICFLILGISSLSCDTSIKNDEANVEEELGTETIDSSIVGKTTLEEKDIDNDLYGFWVGYFEEDSGEEYSQNELYVDEGYYWNRDNKINISIDKIEGDEVIGHSVVAGNDRPFKGTITNNSFKVKEPGDDKYDGEFTFEIIDEKLIGYWKAYKRINIQKRKYTLEKKNFQYNPEIMLERAKEYVNWNKAKERKEFNDEEDFDDWISKDFASATELIYKINASNKLLKKSEVENLKKGDLTIIRNTIYARHGYSFKTRPLRVFFDAQPWYIPVHTNIKADFTEIEKKNIQLLLRYEKNAAEYYDYFGRG